MPEGGERPREGALDGTIVPFRRVVVRREHRARAEEAQRQQRRDEGSTADFTFEETAEALQIPRGAWRHPEVRRFIGLYNGLLQLRQDLPQTVYALDLATKDHPSAPLGEDLLQRYAALDQLAAAGLTILSESLPGSSGTRSPRAAGERMFWSLGAALKRYGLSVIRERPQAGS